MRAERTLYEVEGWGVGELWTGPGRVLAHEFDFGASSGSVEAGGTKAATSNRPIRAAPSGGAESPSGTVTTKRSHVGNGFVPIRRQDLQPALDPHDLIARFRAFLAGDQVELGDIPLELDSGTPFQLEVTRVLRAIPRGEVVSYGELAAIAGHPGAHRAVGSLCARNRFMFLVPCHRVVAANGIGPYGSAGVGIKRRLLRLEGVEL